MNKEVITEAPTFNVDEIDSDKKYEFLSLSDFIMKFVGMILRVINKIVDVYHSIAG